MIPLTPRWLTAIITLVLLLTTHTATTTGKQIRIRPTACPRLESCYTLQDIVQNSSQHFHPYTTFTFQPGYHKVNYSNNVLIKDLSNITLIGEMHASSVVQCISAFGLTFVNATNFTISKLQFILCGAPIPKQPRSPISIIKLLKYSATLCLMQVSEVKDISCTGTQLHRHRTAGNQCICLHFVDYIHAGNTPNSILTFSAKQCFPTLQTAVLTITDSIFQLGSPHSGITGYASGLAVMLIETTRMINITLSNVTAYSNKGDSHSSPVNMLFYLDKPLYVC